MGSSFNDPSKEPSLQSIIEEAFIAHAKDVNKWLRYKGCNREVAEELVQDAFIKLYDQYSGLRDKKSLKAWLIAAAHNAFINYLEKASTRYESHEMYEGQINDHPVGELDEHVGMMDCVSRMLLEFTRKEPERAYAINLQMDSMPILEIALMLDRTEQATREYLSQSKKKLKPYLEECREFVAND